MENCKIERVIKISQSIISSNSQISGKNPRLRKFSY